MEPSNAISEQATMSRSPASAQRSHERHLQPTDLRGCKIGDLLVPQPSKDQSPFSRRDTRRPVARTRARCSRRMLTQASPTRTAAAGSSHSPAGSQPAQGTNQRAAVVGHQGTLAVVNVTTIGLVT